MSSSAPALQLSEFLRARRARLHPADLGLPAGTGRRRTPGLRREELAALAGISIDYYIRLEQGRESNPSGSVLDALARALRLDDEATAHLYNLADHAAGRIPRTPTTQALRPGIRQLLETLRPCPAYVRNRTNDILATNPEGLALLAGIGEWPAGRRNTTRYTFVHPVARTLYTDWAAAAAAAAAAQLRTAVAADPDDAGLCALVAELTQASPEFAALWQRHDVRHHRADRKSFHHPTVGDITFSYENLDTGHGQRIAIYQTVPGTPDHATMTLLALAAEPAQSASQASRQR